MERFVWDPELETGDELIDSQHRGIFELAEGLAATVDAETPDAGVVADAVWRLIDYVTEHFADEEEAMSRAGYSALGPHRSLHEHLSARVLGISAKFFDGQDVDPVEIADLLVDWLRDHILAEDMSYVRSLRDGEA